MIKRIEITKTDPRPASKTLLVNGRPVLRFEGFTPEDHALIVGDRKWRMARGQADAMFGAFANALFDAAKGGEL
jgi:hypothetical protein